MILTYIIYIILIGFIYNLHLPPYLHPATLFHPFLTKTNFITCSYCLDFGRTWFPTWLIQLDSSYHQLWVEPLDKLLSLIDSLQPYYWFWGIEEYFETQSEHHPSYLGPRGWREHLYLFWGLRPVGLNSNRPLVHMSWPANIHVRFLFISGLA